MGEGEGGRGVSSGARLGIHVVREAKLPEVELPDAVVVVHTRQAPLGVAKREAQLREERPQAKG